MQYIKNIFNFPSEIIIGGLAYSVTLIDDLRDDSGAKLDGDIKYGPCAIRIDSGLSIQMQWQVLLHEVIHGILTQTNQDVKDEVIDIIAYGLMGVAQTSQWSIRDEYLRVPKNMTGVE